MHKSIEGKAIPPAVCEVSDIHIGISVRDCQKVTIMTALKEKYFDMHWEYDKFNQHVEWNNIWIRFTLDVWATSATQW